MWFSMTILSFCVQTQYFCTVADTFNAISIILFLELDTSSVCVRLCLAHRSHASQITQEPCKLPKNSVTCVLDPIYVPLIEKSKRPTGGHLKRF